MKKVEATCPKCNHTWEEDLTKVRANPAVQCPQCGQSVKVSLDTIKKACTCGGDCTNCSHH